MTKIIIIDNDLIYQDKLKEKIKELDINMLIETYPLVDNLFKTNTELNNSIILINVNEKNIEDIILLAKSINTRSSIKIILYSDNLNTNFINKIPVEIQKNLLIKSALLNTISSHISKYVKNNYRQPFIISIYSRENKSGNTSLIFNLGYEIQRQTKKKVCILDLSCNETDIENYLNIKINYYIQNLIADGDITSSELTNKLYKYKNTNLYIIKKQDNSNNLLKTTEIEKIISLLKYHFDYILIDTNNKINENLITIHDNSNVILFLLPHNKNIFTNCTTTYEQFDKIGYNNDKIKIILNRYTSSDILSIEEIENRTYKKVSYQIPNNYLTLTDAIIQNNAVYETNPKSNIANAYFQIAKDIIDNKNLINNYEKRQNNGIYDLLQRIGE